ncbi:MAG: hypothetical protein WCP31_03625 [Chloroflexales bacterium]
MTADVLVYAGQMVDRYLSARWKMFFDRIFFNTRTPVLSKRHHRHGEPQGDAYVR